MFKEKKRVKEIADIIRVSRNTIYLELKRGQYQYRTYIYTYETGYSPELAHERYRRNLKEKGSSLKIGNDHELANHIEKMIIENRYSPAAVLGEIRAKGMNFKTTISVRTLYSYIEKGVFLKITNEDLPRRGKRKRKYRRIRPAKRASQGDSIEKRPQHIEDRKQYGHWEMDLLHGRKNTKVSLLVLTERSTREELMIKVPDRKAETIVNAINRLERRHKKLFREKFKTITVDNGSEFSDFRGIEERNRTKIYYCHPYAAYERGSNENQNQMIRRFFPKGTNFTYITQRQITKVQDWLNSYPRGIFDYRSASDMIPLIYCG